MPLDEKLQQEIKTLFEKVRRILSERGKIEADNPEAFCVAMPEAQRRPHLERYKTLRELLPLTSLEDYIAQYQRSQPKNNPYFTDKIPISSDVHDLFREMQGLTPEACEVLLQLKWLLCIKKKMYLFDGCRSRFNDKEALQVRIVLFDMEDFETIGFKAITECKAGYRLRTRHDMTDNPKDKNDDALLRLSLREVPDDDHPPLLYFGITILQTYSVSEYEQLVGAILEEHVVSEQCRLLSVTSPCLNQPALNSAIGFDNTHAALAFIQTIAEHQGLTDKQKRSLLNYRSESQGFQDKAIYSATPLLLAIQRGNQCCVDALLAKDMIDVNLPDLKGLTPLDWAFIMADARTFDKLLEREADLSQAYYFKHPWIEDTTDRKAHPELRQIMAHFWDMPEKFYTLRQHQPGLAKCNQLMEVDRPRPKLKPIVVVSKPSQNDALPKALAPYFKPYLDAICNRAASIKDDAPRVGVLLEGLVDFFTREASIYFFTNDWPAFKTAVEKRVKSLQKSFEKEAAHQPRLLDSFMMLVNNLIHALKRFCHRLSRTQAPFQEKPYTFFAQKLSTARLVEELGSRMAQG